MNKNCFNCFNFNDRTLKCQTMLAPLDDCSCFVPDAEAKIKQERDCMRYIIDHGSPHAIKQQAKILADVMGVIQ
jgi:hypothetical protein